MVKSQNLSKNAARLRRKQRNSTMLFYFTHAQQALKHLIINLLRIILARIKLMNAWYLSAFCRLDYIVSYLGQKPYQFYSSNLNLPKISAEM